jgi:hypothetical protein
MPVSVSRYWGSPPKKSSYAATSSQGVNAPRALGNTTRLVGPLTEEALRLFGNLLLTNLGKPSSPRKRWVASPIEVSVKGAGS